MRTKELRGEKHPKVDLESTKMILAMTVGLPPFSSEEAEADMRIHMMTFIICCIVFIIEGRST